MNDIEYIMTKLKGITAIIHDAQVKLGQGTMVQLSHLDEEIAQICDKILTLPPAEAKKTQAPMANMIGKLDALAIALQDFQEEMKEKIK